MRFYKLHWKNTATGDITVEPVATHGDYATVNNAVSEFSFHHPDWALLRVEEEA